MADGGMKADNRVRIVKAVETCSACPLQYECETDDGKFVYVRFRWDILTIGIGASMDEAVENAMGETPVLRQVRIDNLTDLVGVKYASLHVIDWDEVV